MAHRKIRLELLPQERAALLKWNFTPEVRDQLDACASSTDVATITLSSVDIDWLASDLTRDVTNLIQRNPVPAVLIAMGVGFLAAVALRRSSST